MLSLLFADDTACLTSGNNLKDVIKKANVELQKLSQWFRANKMAVNVSKTKYIIFKPSNKKVEIGPGEGVLFNPPLAVRTYTSIEKIFFSDA
jgi:hypothetical protein